MKNFIFLSKTQRKNNRLNLLKLNDDGSFYFYSGRENVKQNINHDGDILFCSTKSYKYLINSTDYDDILEIEFKKGFEYLPILKQIKNVLKDSETKILPFFEKSNFRIVEIVNKYLYTYSYEYRWSPKKRKTRFVVSGYHENNLNRKSNLTTTSKNRFGVEIEFVFENCNDKQRALDSLPYIENSKYIAAVERDGSLPVDSFEIISTIIGEKEFPKFLNEIEGVFKYCKKDKSAGMHIHYSNIQFSQKMFELHEIALSELVENICDCEKTSLNLFGRVRENSYNSEKKLNYKENIRRSFVYSCKKNDSIITTELRAFAAPTDKQTAQQYFETARSLHLQATARANKIQKILNS